MPLALKDKNTPALASIWLVNAAVYFAVVYGGLDLNLLAETWQTLAGTPAILGPTGVMIVLVGVLNALVGTTTKNRLVFCRWNDALPGCRAFTEHMHTDPRIDVKPLSRYGRPFPTEPAEQNALWYRWYREFAHQDGVRHAHRTYLLARDWTAFAALVLALGGPMAVWQAVVGRAAWWYIAGLLLQYVLVSKAARNSGVRFVQTVLAQCCPTNGGSGWV